MTTLLFTHHGVSVSIQHRCHAVFCTRDYGLGRVKDPLHPVPSCITELLLPPACLVLHSGHILSAGLLSIMLLMAQHMGDEELYSQPFTALTVPTSTGLMTLPLSVYPGCTPATLCQGHADG